MKDQLPSAFGKALAQTSVVGRMPLLALPTEPIVAEVQPRHAKLSSWNSNVKNAKPTRTKTKLTFDRYVYCPSPSSSACSPYTDMMFGWCVLAFLD